MNRFPAIGAVVVVLTTLGVIGGTVIYHHRMVAAPAATPNALPPWDPMLPVNIAKRNQITAILDSAPTSRPSAEDSAILLEEASSDPSFAIRIRAMAVLPFISDRERAISILIASLRDRAPEASGGGNVPLYATTYLADMKATRAIPAVTEWINFLKANHPYDPRVNTMILKKNTDDLQRLQAAATQPAP